MSVQQAEAKIEGRKELFGAKYAGVACKSDLKNFNMSKKPASFLVLCNNFMIM
jgi:hypothetical protein